MLVVFDVQVSLLVHSSVWIHCTCNMAVTCQVMLSNKDMVMTQESVPFSTANSKTTRDTLTLS